MSGLRLSSSPYLATPAMDRLRARAQDLANAQDWAGVRALPSPRLELRQDQYQVGIGRAHMVSEAWIDGLSRWVVLDGQNGLYWTGEDGAPLGAVALCDAVRTGATWLAYVSLRDDFTHASAQYWFSYFANVTSKAGTWAEGPYSVVFQRDRLASSNRLEHGSGAFYPDLSELGVATVLDDGRPALRLSTAHPYATGFAVDGTALEGDTLVLDTAPGDHEHELAVRTGYGILSGHALRYRVEG
jgi:hypothetical protein